MAGHARPVTRNAPNHATALSPGIKSPYLSIVMFYRAIRFAAVATAAMTLISMACSSASSHTEEVLAWRAERLASLQSGDSWLALVGLYWLEEGDNPFGSNQALPVVMPASHVPPSGGRFHLADGVVTFFAVPGLDVMWDGRPVDRMILRDDSAGDITVLTLGTLTFHVIKRAGELAVRVKDSASEALAGFEGLDYYPIDEKWRIMARYVAHSGGAMQMAVPTFQGPTQFLESPGSLEFEIDGKPHSLAVFAEAGDDWLFVIFGDETNGRATYGGGRFIYVPRADDNGRVDLDFNRAYSPPCVFTPFATCPLPPPQNRLALKVEAGEKNYAQHLTDMGER
ncbi:MAG: DUF1684 domain-containing protein [Candidatus Marinimicrobia bacterium]|nr:DUF1684 domain-containing protein [Candidatus Neomarinimicrobiota bacterium]